MCVLSSYYVLLYIGSATAARSRCSSSTWIGGTYIYVCRPHTKYYYSICTPPIQVLLRKPIYMPIQMLLLKPIYMPIRMLLLKPIYMPIQMLLLRPIYMPIQVLLLKPIYVCRPHTMDYYTICTRTSSRSSSTWTSYYVLLYMSPPLTMVHTSISVSSSSMYNYM